MLTICCKWQTRMVARHHLDEHHLLVKNILRGYFPIWLLHYIFYSNQLLHWAALHAHSTLLFVNFS